MRLVILSCVLFLAASAASAQDTSLTGLWYSERWFGPALRGELVLQRSAAGWRATIAGRASEAHVARDSVSIDFPAGGTFIGTFAARRDSVRGQWVQVAAQNFGRYASPLTLLPCGSGCYRGRVEPLEDTFTFYMQVKPTSGGTLGGFLRNPERNQGVFIRLSNLVRHGDTVDLRNVRDQVIESGLLREGDLSVRLRFATHDFRRIPADSFTNFYPRGRPRVAYRYAPPRPRNDGWAVADAGDVGMSRERLSEMVQAIIDNGVDSANAHRPHAILVARNGKLVLEEYFHGEHADKAHDTRSASKTLTAIVLGAAMQAGMKVGPDTRVYATMGVRSDTLEPRKRAMTVRHLLTMSSGLDCDDDSNTPHPGSEDYLTNQDTNPDWTWTVLGLKTLQDPGAQAVYCSINPYLAGQVIAKAAGRPFVDLVSELVGAPLQMSQYYISLDPLGSAYMGGGARFVARDVLKLAQLYANGGTWNGRRVVSEAWIRESTQPLVPMGTNQYGYLWYVVEYPYAGRKTKAYAAFGNGGQFWMFIPELSLSIAGFGGNYADRSAVITANVLIPKYIIPAVLSGRRP